MIRWLLLILLFAPRGPVETPSPTIELQPGAGVLTLTATGTGLLGILLIGEVTAAKGDGTPNTQCNTVLLEEVPTALACGINLNSGPGQIDLELPGVRELRIVYQWREEQWEETITLPAAPTLTWLGHDRVLLTATGDLWLVRGGWTSPVLLTTDQPVRIPDDIPGPRDAAWLPQVGDQWCNAVGCSAPLDGARWLVAAPWVGR